MTPLIVQHKNFALGNFVMITPTLQKLAEIHNTKIDVFFNTDYVEQCYLDCPFINIVSSEYQTPLFTNALINQNIPDYQYVFKTIIGEDWTPKYHTYVDSCDEFEAPKKDYLLVINGLAGTAWEGKKEIDEKTLYAIKESTNLPIFFTGSERDIERNKCMLKIADKIAIGNIRQSLAWVRGAKKIVANDTGLAHCAGAMNKDILILWKDTPFVKNQNPGKQTKYSQKQNWIKDIVNYGKA